MGTEQLPKIKLCGMFRPEDIYFANELLPDYVGFVMNFPKSHRSIDREKAMLLRKKLSPEIKAVGVFVDEKEEICAEFANSRIIDLIQLHGNENEEYVRRLRVMTDVPIIKVVKAAHAEDIEQAQKSSADYLLLDGGMGEGKSFDHEIITGVEITKPFFLAGGLTPENVSAVIRWFHPFAVDVSSALETYGMKDKNKMAAFVNAVRKEIV